MCIAPTRDPLKNNNYLEFEARFCPFSQDLGHFLKIFWCFWDLYMKVDTERPGWGGEDELSPTLDDSERSHECVDVLNRSEFVWRWNLKKDLVKNISGARRYTLSKLRSKTPFGKKSLRTTLANVVRKLFLPKGVLDLNFERVYLRAPEIFFTKSFFKFHLQTNSDRLSTSTHSWDLSESSNVGESSSSPPQPGLSVSTFI